ncbi:MAG: hypothetical protein CUN54_03800 [Phototrophicales bacterium]|nr:MAG: hypothetical protein CUN54_03800 [Phototrophicales bacterium]
MRAIKRIWNAIRNFMIIFSFIVNIILLVVLIVLGVLIFEIKSQVAQPLIGGLHSSFVGLDNATIDWTIPVRDELPISLQVPINQNTMILQPERTLNGAPLNQGETVVTLTRDVPLVLQGAFIQTGDLTLRNATVNLSLPQGTQLPVSLDMMVALNTEVPVELDVRAVIPLQETQLHDPVENLQLLFEPLTRALYNLPDGFDEVPSFVGDVVGGNGPDLMSADNEYTQNPWPGYSRTAGVGYEHFDETGPFGSFGTGIVTVGGIPVLDELIRPELYENNDTPQDRNERATQEMNSLGVEAQFFTGGLGARVSFAPAPLTQAVASQLAPADQSAATGGPESNSPSSTGNTTTAPIEDFGILPTPKNPDDE